MSAPALAEAHARGLIRDVADPAGLTAAMTAPVAAYAGFDPTAGSLHVGHLVPVMLLRLLARHGHPVSAVIGGATAQVGDPSGRNTARPLARELDVMTNTRRLTDQLEGLLPAGTQLFDNAAWLGTAHVPAFLREIGAHVPVSRMLAQESAKARLASGEGMSALEFFYPLLQAADFLELHRRIGVRLQIGGSDQWGNITAGIDLIRRIEGVQTFGITQPLVTTAAGAKMGKSADGAVWLDPALTDDHAFYQFWRDCADADVGRFLRLFTELPLDEIAGLEALEGSEINAAKKRLAFEVTALARGPEAAERARKAAEAVFEGAGDDAGLPELTLDPGRLAGAGIPLAELVHDAGLAGSRSAARRLVAQGGVRLDGIKIDDPARPVSASDFVDGFVRLSAGKRRHVRLRSGR